PKGSSAAGIPSLFQPPYPSQHPPAGTSHTTHRPHPTAGSKMIAASPPAARRFPWSRLLTAFGRLVTVLFSLAGGVVAVGVIEQQPWSWRGTLQLLALTVAIGLVCLALTWRVDADRRRTRLAAVAVALITLLVGAAVLEGF